MELGEGCLALLPRVGRDLHQAWAWQRLLEQLQGIVIIQDLDSLCDGDHLLASELRDLFPLLLLAIAVLLQIRQKLLVLIQGFLGVLQVMAHFRDLDRQLSTPLCLCLDGLGVGSNLLLLCFHQCGCILLGLFLRCGDVLQVLLHTILDLLQHTNNLATLWDIALTGRRLQEGHDHVPLGGAHAGRVHHQALQHLGSLRLEEAATHASANCRDCLGQRINVCHEFL
mmetsp:Transcript_5129/g.11414  ORF Transcript_5129/g.11414 Transcript_5129/m.11414 type:complete len:226 (-) Transcript_5129:106-783(-)